LKAIGAYTLNNSIPTLEKTKNFIQKWSGYQANYHSKNIILSTKLTLKIKLKTKNTYLSSIYHLSLSLLFL